MKRDTPRIRILIRVLQNLRNRPNVHLMIIGVELDIGKYVPTMRDCVDVIERKGDHCCVQRDGVSQRLLFHCRIGTFVKRTPLLAQSQQRFHYVCDV